MLDPTLVTAITAALEQAVNQALQYDPATLKKLEQLQGRSLAVELRELDAPPIGAIYRRRCNAQSSARRTRY